MSSQDERIDCPSLSQILSELTPQPPALPSRGSESLPVEEQETLFRALQDVVKKAEDSDSKDFEGVQAVLGKLWECKSHYLVQCAETLANGSRQSSWRRPYGQAGILQFFLQLIASSEQIDNDVLLHSLRLVGNSCADTDENRAIVVKDNYTSAILRHLNPDLIHVAIPVIYNTCIEFEPAQSQLAANKLVYILVRLIKDGALEDNDTLLNFSQELIDLLAEQEQGIQQSPDGTILLLMELVLDKEITLVQFASLVNCLMIYLDNKRFQDICISRRMVDCVLSVLSRSLSIEVDRSSSEEVQLLSQLRLKINQTLSEISASPLFTEVYPLNSSLTQTLKSWLTTTEDQLQICSCVMLGNLARSDEVCEVMVRDLNLHKDLIVILKSDARGAVLHSALGFLKNLAIAGDNRLHMGEAGIVPAISRLWGFESVPQVQFAATSIARQIIISSVENIFRLLEFLPVDEEGPSTSKQTYLSKLLSLFEKTDSTPIKTEVGRIIASICRTIIPKSREQDTEANNLLERLFTLHEGVALPIGAMITQTQWPVVRSEGWFALALMASNKMGSVAVVDCLHKMDVYPLLEETFSRAISDSTDETDKLRLTKDRDNIVVLVQELLKNDSETLPASYRATLERLMNNHVSQNLKTSKEI